MPGKVKNIAGLQKQPEADYAVLPPENGDPGVIRIENKALSSIVRKAACQVEGVTRITGNSIVDNIAEFMGSRKIQDRSIQISTGDSGLLIELSINVAYGFSLPEVASNVQSSVYDAILEQTGLTASQINVVIREMEELDSGGEVPEEEPGKKNC